MTPDPLDPEQQAVFRELDGFRRIQDLARRGCGDSCLCKLPDAMTTPLDLQDLG